MVRVKVKDRARVRVRVRARARIRVRVRVRVRANPNPNPNPNPNQAQLSSTRGSSTALLVHTLRHQPRQLYVGHTMNLMREACFTACYLGLYARLRQVLAPEDDRMPLPIVAAVSATTGALAWLVCYPFDVVKSVQQSQAPGKHGPLNSISGAAAHVWRHGGGWRGFYRGAAASTVRAVLVTCSRLVAYEQAKTMLAMASW